MTREGWREAVEKAANDVIMLDLLAKLLAEQDAAKQVLQAAGFGCIGRPWPKVVEEVLSRVEAYASAADGVD